MRDACEFLRTSDVNSKASHICICAPQTLFEVCKPAGSQTVFRESRCCSAFYVSTPQEIDSCASMVQPFEIQLAINATSNCRSPRTAQDKHRISSRVQLQSKLSIACHVGQMFANVPSKNLFSFFSRIFPMKIVCELLFFLI